MVKNMLKLGGVLAVCLAAFGCGAAKTAAQAALSSTDTSVNALKGQASQYVPDQFKAVQDALATAHDNFNKGDYAAALASARDVASKLKDLGPAIKAKKDELTKSWADMSGNLPQMLSSIKDKVAELGKEHHLPQGVDASAVSQAKESLPTMTQGLSDAMSSFKSGNIADAVAKAKGLYSQAAQTMSALGMKAPAEAAAAAPAASATPATTPEQ